MRTRSLLPLIVHATAWAILGSAFVFIGAPQIRDALRARSFGPILPYHTTNSYLLRLLKIRDGSERLLWAFSSLPRNRPIAVVLREGDDEGTFLGYVVSYFAWPREVRFVSVKPGTSIRVLHSLDQTTLAAILFCGIDPPPAMHPLIPIGSGLIMIPTAAAPETSAP